MAGRQIKQLLKAHRDGDDLAFRRAAQQIIDEEEARNHLALAQDLRKLLSGGPVAGYEAEPAMPLMAPIDPDGGVPLLSLRMPQRQLGDLVLDTRLETRLRELSDEVSRWSSLDDAGIPRRQRILFMGPPGCGKTTAAEALASELALPLATVRLDAIVSSYLGETAANLRRIFDFAEHQYAVVLFDEFDALGKERGDPSDHGEFRRVVAAVLQMIEQYRGRSLIIAATNHSETLDRALWRRFDEVMEFPHPSTAQIKAVLRRLLIGSGCPALEIDRQATRMKGLPYAAAEKAANDARRKAFLQSRVRVSREDLVEAATEVLNRPW